MTKLLCCVFIIFILKISKCTQAGNQFVSEINCVPLTECPMYLNLLKPKIVSVESVNRIQEAHCKFEGSRPFVWCVTVKTKGPTITDPEVNTNVPNRIEPPLLTSVPYTTTAIPEVVETIETTPLPEKPTTTEPPKETEKSIIDKVNPTFLPAPITCGKQEYENRILGGRETGIDEFPWLAILQYRIPGRKKILNGCGGSLINNRYVLTAAHCLTQRTGPPLSILLGEYDTKNETDCENDEGEIYCSPPPISVPIEKIMVHANWRSKAHSSDDDIGLIRLSSIVQFSEFIRPICLPTAAFNPTISKYYIVAGWGRTEKGSPSNIKLKVTVPYIKSDLCSKLLTTNISDGMLCAGGEEGKDACLGDSGGPLMYFDRNTASWTEAGIVSIGPKGCGRDGSPAVYTYIPKYIDWINANVID